MLAELFILFIISFAYSQERHILAFKKINSYSIDTNFTIAQTFGDGRLYDSIWHSEVYFFATQWFLQQYGIDWTDGDLVGGSYVLPQGTMSPYVNGEDYSYRLRSDIGQSKDENDWIIFETGYVVVMKENGTFPGGTFKGTQYQSGDTLKYAEYNLLNVKKKDKWDTFSPLWREAFLIGSRRSAGVVVGGCRNEKGIFKEMVIDDHLQSTLTF